ncbi:two-component system capsular synthesis response regulator RcsB [Luteibacter sp. Sphag1AF]|uniref:response regulator transcription factor n=1 Tax=Luteibacter sp. Sphag1AF TaxID=2587031 RepID=UPI001607EBCB|nr:response regulator transcription factor [Luteibacter sp. Sphag1AF]MBB3228993.1 two-component system capsular synthesis response regulator RcsB [Luteibacter sp. Sphag1AF]
MSLKVILADDHPLVAIGGSLALRTAGINVVATAKNADELVQLLREHPCDVVITDFLMPSESQNDGLTLIENVTREFPDVSLLVLTMIDRASALHAMLARGAAGIVDKRSPMDELADAVRAVDAGETYLSESLLHALNEAEKTATPTTDMPLSPRESDVIRMFVSGLSLGEIAEREGKSVKTISRQKRDAMRKLGVDHDSLLGQYARDHGLI